MKSCPVRGLLAAAMLLGFASRSGAHIYQWELIDPQDPEAGRQASVLFSPDGRGETADEDANLSGLDLSRAWLSGLFLERAAFSGSVLVEADLSGSDLTWSGFRNANLAGAYLNDALLGDADFEDADLRGARLDGAYLRDAVFRDASVVGTSLRGVQGLTEWMLEETRSYRDGDLRGIGLGENDLSGWSFEDQDLSGADFSGSDLNFASFQGAVVAGASFRGTTGVDIWELRLTASYAARDLRGIDLSDTDLRSAEFDHQDLSHARFEGTVLSDADLEDANLSGADFRGALLDGASFRGAVVTDACFRGARGLTQWMFQETAGYQQQTLRGVDLGELDLSGWNFDDQDLTGARFEGAYLEGTDFRDAEITHASFRDAKRFRFDQIAETQSYRDHNLQGVDLSELDLRWADFDDQDLRGARLEGSMLDSAYFDDADLRNVSFAGSTGLEEHEFRRSKSYEDGDLSGIDLSEVDLTGWDFREQGLQHAGFRDAILVGADFDDSDLSHADLSGADLEDAFFPDARIDYASFRDARHLDFYQITQTANWDEGNLIGVDLSGWDFEESYEDFDDMDLTDARFEGALIHEMTFKRAVLGGVSFEGAKFGGDPSSLFEDADITGVSLRGVRTMEGEQLPIVEVLESTASWEARSLRGVDLSENELTSYLDLRYFDLRDTNFSGLEVQNISFWYSVLHHADFSDTVFPDPAYSAPFSVSDLRGSVGLDSRFYHSYITYPSTRDTVDPEGNVRYFRIPTVRDYQPREGEEAIGIHVSYVFEFFGGALSFVFEDDSWGSTISFARDERDIWDELEDGVSDLIELTFDESLTAEDLRALDGAVYQLFAWQREDADYSFEHIVFDETKGRFDVSRLGTEGVVVFHALPLIAGDANVDGMVDLLDLSILAAHFNEGVAGSWNGDFNGDGVVDLLDLSILAGNFGASNSVPEPAGWVVMGLMAGVAGRRRAS